MRTVHHKPGFSTDPRLAGLLQSTQEMSAMNGLCLTVLCDENYVEPALLTAMELLQRKPASVPLFLVYLANPGDSAETEQILLDFQSGVAAMGQVQLIKIRNDVFGPFTRYHFTNSILYKLLIPSILQFDHIVNVDAGFLLGRKFDQLWSEIDRMVVAGAFSHSILSAFCGRSDTELPARLRRHPHNALYPTGWVLLFNRQNYVADEFYARVMRAYQLLKDELVWAEQDLLCLLLGDGQLVELPLKDEVVIEQLGLEGLRDDKVSLGEGGDYCLYKITGTLKPWKLWVLDPRKKFYLERRKALERKIALGSYGAIMKNRHAVTHEGLSRAFLELNELKLNLQGH